MAQSEMPLNRPGRDFNTAHGGPELWRALLLLLLCLCPQTVSAADGQFRISVVDASTKLPIACRMHLLSGGKRPKKIEGVPYLTDHFVFDGAIALNLSNGFYTFELEHGPEYTNITGNFTINRDADDSRTIELRRAVDMSEEGWYSGDLCVRRPLRDIELLMKAEDLHLAQVMAWWNDKVDPLGKMSKAARNAKDGIVTFDNNRVYEFACGGISRPGAELSLFHWPQPLAMNVPDAAEYPPVVSKLLEARKQTPVLWVDAASSYSWDLPMLVALGQIDSVSVANGHLCRKTIQVDDRNGKPRDKQFFVGPFGFARWQQEVYFKLLECGLRLPPSASSGSGMSPNPVGYNRVYVHLDSSFDGQQWWKNFHDGQAIVTNGPLIRPKVENELPGHVFLGQVGKELELHIAMSLSMREPISYLEVIQNGEVKQSIRFEDYVKDGQLPPIRFKESGWFALRAVSEQSDTYRFCLTAPYYVEFGGEKRVSKKAAQFFLDWVFERARQLKLDDATQRAEVLAYHRKARDFWQGILAKANAE
jgi:hypothetical protein